MITIYKNLVNLLFTIMTWCEQPNLKNGVESEKHELYANDYWWYVSGEMKDDMRYVNLYWAGELIMSVTIEHMTFAEICEIIMKVMQFS